MKNEGFGILTEIDVKEKMKEKLGLHMNKYIILGACNPPNAYKAILTEENIGLMLPCNVIVYEKAGKTVLSVIRPTVAMQRLLWPARPGWMESNDGLWRLWRNFYVDYFDSYRSCHYLFCSDERRWLWHSKQDLGEGR